MGWPADLTYYKLLTDSGSLLGGIVGASGAALAVYLTLAGQRKEDRERIHSAVVSEIIEFTILAIGVLELCENIRAGSLDILKTKLEEIVEFPTPIIYPAIFDKIGLLHSPHRVVGFYMKIIGVKYSARIIARSPFSEGKTLRGEDVKIVVEPLALACQLAKLIIENSDKNAWFDGAMSEVTSSQIDSVLKKTIENFGLKWKPL